MKTVARAWRRWLVGGLIALGAINIVFLAAFTAPRRLARRGLEARRAEVAAELARERERVETRKAEQQTLRQNAADVARMEGEVLGTLDLDLVPTLSEVNAMAREGGLRPQAQSYQPSEDAAMHFQRVTIQMPIDGSYKALVGFLRQVEESKRFITIDRVSLRATDQGRGAGLAVGLSAFFRREGRT